jgi:hypothetical protein
MQEVSSDFRVSADLIEEINLTCVFHVEHRIANFYIDELACAWSADRRLDVRFGDAGEADPIGSDFR